MHHPFSGNLADLSESDLQNKITELTKKYSTAYRLGNNQMLTQLQTFITIYREELKQRSMSKKTDENGDLDNLINVE
jgi:uncharacterized membrane protein (DUF106 family)